MTREEIAALEPNELARLAGVKAGETLSSAMIRITRWIVLELIGKKVLARDE